MRDDEVGERMEWWSWVCGCGLIPDTGVVTDICYLRACIRLLGNPPLAACLCFFAGAGKLQGREKERRETAAALWIPQLCPFSLTQRESLSCVRVCVCVVCVNAGLTELGACRVYQGRSGAVNRSTQLKLAASCHCIIIVCAAFCL